jgi:hypothetical protein
MKKLISILFIISCPVFCMQAMGNAAAVAASDSSSSAAAAEAEREIRIIETIVTSGLLRSAPAPAVSAWLTGAQIDLTFLQYLGTVTITVANAQETVYSATLTAEDGTQTTVSTAGWSPGSYTITITRSNGQTLTGDFEL